MFNISSCAVVQKQLTTKGWQAVAAASQSYHCVSSAQMPLAATTNIKLRASENKGSLLFSKMTPMRDFGVVQDVPTMGDSITEGVVESYVKNVGEFVEADEVVARIETDKVTVDILSQHAGVITKYFAEEGDTIEVGGQFLEIDTDAKAPAGGAAPPKQEAPAAAAPPTPAAAPQAAAPPTPAPAAPAAPKGPAPTPAAGASSTGSQTAKKAPTEITGQRMETRVKMSRMR